MYIKEKPLREKIIGSFQDISEGYLIVDENAPQGQNRYSTNFLLEDKQGTQLLLKTIILNRVPEAVREQVDDEINVCKNLSSPHVVKLIDSFETKEFVFMVFPFLEGKSLAELLETQELSIDQAIDICIGILRGVVDINRRGSGKVVHQDIKPENVLITKDETVVLLDLGAARYKKSQFRGQARRNFKYASPEQIKSSRPNSAEELRLVLDSKADVFATGIIMYSMLERRHPFEVDGRLPADVVLDALPLGSITNPEVGDDIRKIVTKMLEYEALNRLSATEALAALESGSLKEAQLDNGKMFYCAASSTKRFTRLKNQYPDLFDGLVLEATQIPTRRQDIVELHHNIKTMLIDPQTYFFQKPELLGMRQEKKLTKFSYYRKQAFWEDPKALIKLIKNKDIKIIEFITDVFYFQLENGADFVVAPYFYISEYTDEFWDVDFLIAEIAADVYKELDIQKPLIKGVALSEEVLLSNSKKKIINHLQSLDTYRGYLVMLSSTYPDVITNEAWLNNAKDFFTYLMAEKEFVLWNRADIFGLFLAKNGLNFTVGEYQKQKKFNLIPSNGGRRAFYFYVTDIFARIKWPDAYDALRGLAKVNFKCSSECCGDVDFTSLQHRDEEDLATHFLIKLKEKYVRYLSGGIDAIEKDLNTGVDLYSEIHGSDDKIVEGAIKKDIKPSSVGHITIWKSVLGI